MDINEEPIEERNITIKRKYTENYPALKVGKAAKIRNKVLEAVKDGKITKEEFESILKEMTTDSTRWIRRNTKYLNVSEDGITLSKTGKRILNELTPSLDINEKASPFKVANAMAEEIFGEFGIATLAYDELDRVIDVKRADKLAKKYGESSFMSLTEVDMEELLNKNPRLIKENKTNKNMKNQFVFESFNDFVNSLNEATVVMDAMDPGSKVLAKLLKKHKVTMEIIDNEGPSGWPEVELTGDRKDLEKVLASENGWDDAGLADYIEESNGTHTIKVRSMITEAFGSQRLAQLFMGTNGKLDKHLAKAFYGSTKVAMDKVQDEDIISTDPQTAYKAKQTNTIVFYISDNEKENPHAPHDGYRSNQTIPGGGYLLAVTSGGNKFYDQTWTSSSRYSSRKNDDRNLKIVGNNPTDSIGIGKKYKGWDATGLYNVKRIAEVADRAIVINVELLQQKYSTTNKRNDRHLAKSGAAAFKSHDDFKQENKTRYEQILATKAASLPLDKMVADAIDTLTQQIKDGLSKGEKTKYGEISIGTNRKGNHVKMKDASNHMSSILDDYSRYVDYVQQDAESEKRYGSSESWYQREVKNYAKRIKDGVNKIESFDYAW